ncbi:trigger factor [Streptomonospora nanhaiensis]|uniref:Trigger factor n=1 Tax=Streptomonospora nanhaiensis TaxID=1323731 RepID=A0A853BVG8_9ACTN|nr:trigger factor [Streptomonospora nanhaiensis]MBV2363481.1 trigger factor [Streptomonospora nanhaiensis]MBX9389692.1 trigger factor [Streptomonospora nanhaiensis]NYI98491.1 trigger factor [Streptomonospora nanhaiensis]
MKTDVEELSPTRVKLTIEVPFEELEHAFDVTYKSLAKQVRIKGFRPGKAPARLIDRHVGRGAVISEAVNHAVPELYNEAIQKEEIFALGQPDVEVTKLEDNAELAFTAEVDVRPKFEVTGYEGLEVTVDDAEPTEEQVEDQVNNLRERFSTLVGVDRPVEVGDHVSIDLSAAADGEPLEDVQTSGLSYEVGTNTVLEGLDDTLQGMSAGDSATFATKLVGGEYEGREADVTVTVHSVKVKELPELDDEFAQLASEFDTIEELRADIRSRMEQVRRLQQLAQGRDRALEKLVDSIDIPLPESVVEEELKRRRDSLEQQLAQSGLTKEAYLETQEQTEEEFEEELAKGAASAVKAGFILDQLAIQEELSADNSELSQYVVEQAQRMGVSPDQLAQHLVETNQIRVAYTEVVRSKAMDLVLSKAVITDESGNVIESPKADSDAEDGEEAETVEDVEAATAAGAEELDGDDTAAEPAAADAPAAEAESAEADRK